jgi:hypothetical protein
MINKAKKAHQLLLYTSTQKRRSHACRCDNKIIIIISLIDRFAVRKLNYTVFNLFVEYLQQSKIFYSYVIFKTFSLNELYMDLHALSLNYSHDPDPRLHTIRDNGCLSNVS